MQINAFKNSRLNYLIDLDDFNESPDPNGETTTKVYYRRANGIEVNMMVDPSMPRLVLFSKVPMPLNGHIQNLRDKKSGELIMPPGTFYNVSGISPNINVDNYRDGYLIRAQMVFLGDFIYEFEEDQVG